MRRLALAVLVLLGVLTPVASAAPPACPADRVLVLAAMPLELHPLLEATDVDRAVELDGRTFYEGRLGGRPVVLAMTGIGMGNAAETATVAFEHARCRYRAAVFSGVAGSKHPIGDVAVPRRWTADGGRTWIDVAPGMYRAARSLRIGGLARSVPVGDAACLCPGVDAPTPVTLPHQPVLRVGGDGTSGDTFGGRVVPCVPGGGDVAGCQPCLVGTGLPHDALDFASDVPDPGMLRDLLRPPDETTTTFASQDMETAAVARVARRYGVPFLGIRAVSDGPGDPLHLPGFPAQFFAYRQLAGDNAAAVTVAFLRRWR